VAFVFKVLGAETTKDPKVHGGRSATETPNLFARSRKRSDTCLEPY